MWKEFLSKVKKKKNCFSQIIASHSGSLIRRKRETETNNKHKQQQGREHQDASSYYCNVGRWLL
jgi:hypothetical protein